jgi:hypothetical protein
MSSLPLSNSNSYPNYPIGIDKHSSVNQSLASLLGFSPLELQAPRLTNSSPQAFKVFLPLFRLYKSKHGQQSCLDLIDSSTRYGIAHFLHVPNLSTSKFTDSDTLIKALAAFHERSFDSSDISRELSCVAMTSSTDFSEELIFTYLDEFLSNYSNRAFLQFATQKQISDSLLHGLQPKHFRALVSKCDHTTLDVTHHAILLTIKNYKCYLTIHHILNPNGPKPTRPSHQPSSSVQPFTAAVTATASTPSPHYCTYCKSSTHNRLTPHGIYACPTLLRRYGPVKFVYHNSGPSGTIIIDSGCNISYTNTSPTIASDRLTTISPSAADNVALADGSLIPISCDDTYLDLPVKVVPQFPNSLLSVSQLATKTNQPAYVIFDDKECITIDNNHTTTKLITHLKQISDKNHFIHHTIPLTSNGLYSSTVLDVSCDFSASTVITHLQ